MLFNIFVVVHIVTCVLLTIVVLMQSSKGSGLSGAFGGGGGQALMGGREAATFLSKTTTYLAIVFMITSLSLAFLSAGNSGGQAESALRRAAQKEKWGGMIPEEQKNVEEILGTVPPVPEGTEEDQGEDQPAQEEPSNQ